MNIKRSCNINVHIKYAVEPMEMQLLFVLRLQNHLHAIPAYNENIESNGMFYNICIYILSLIIYLIIVFFITSQSIILFYSKRKKNERLRNFLISYSSLQ